MSTAADLDRPRGLKAGLRYLYGLQRTGIKFGLANTRKALARLGHPERGQRYVHVAGTNGKGSVSAMVAAMLAASGLRCGLYTSPHLSRFGERIRVNGDELGPSEFSLLVERVRKETQGIPLTFFEFATLMAILRFKEEKTDAAVLEVGMGGRLDATNAVRPRVCAITGIAVEHTSYLGGTLREIASEKAGILKRGVPCVTSARGVALEVIRQRAGETGAQLFIRGRDFSLVRRDGEEFGFRGVGLDLKGLKVALPGVHQVENAALAISAIALLNGTKGLNIGEDAMRDGLTNVSWPGRIETLRESPLIIADGAHNPAAMKALARYLKGLGRRLIAVAGVLQDKDAAGIIKPLVPLAATIITCSPRSPRSLDPAELAQIARNLGANAVAGGSVREAIDSALKSASANDVICITGSLYTVGEAREHLLGIKGDGLESAQ